MNFKPKKYNKSIYHFEKKFLNTLIEDKRSCVVLEKRTHHLALHPFHFNEFTASIKELLDSGVAKYDPNFDGILLGYKNLTLGSNVGAIYDDYCYIHFNIEADFFIFKPFVGKKVRGIVNKKTKDHVGCLVHKTFNVSVPKPEDDEKWLGKSAHVNNEVLIVITYTDFTSRLPYIKGKIKSILSEDSGFSTSEENTVNSKIVFNSEEEEEEEQEQEEEAQVEDVGKVKKRKRHDESIEEERPSKKRKQSVNEEDVEVSPAKTKKSPQKNKQNESLEDDDVHLDTTKKKRKERRKSKTDLQSSVIEEPTRRKNKSLSTVDDVQLEEELNPDDEENRRKERKRKRSKSISEEAAPENEESISRNIKSELLETQLNEKSARKIKSKKDKRKTADLEKSEEDEETDADSDDSTKSRKRNKKLKQKLQKQIHRVSESELDTEINLNSLQNNEDEAESDDSTKSRRRNKTIKKLLRQQLQAFDEGDDNRPASKAERRQVKHDLQTKFEEMNDSELSNLLHSEVDLDDSKSNILSALKRSHNKSVDESEDYEELVEERIKKHRKKVIKEEVEEPLLENMKQEEKKKKKKKKKQEFEENETPIEREKNRHKKESHETEEYQRHSEDATKPTSTEEFEVSVVKKKKKSKKNDDFDSKIDLLHSEIDLDEDVKTGIVKASLEDSGTRKKIKKEKH